MGDRKQGPSLGVENSDTLGLLSLGVPQFCGHKGFAKFGRYVGSESMEKNHTVGHYSAKFRLDGISKTMVQAHPEAHKEYFKLCWTRFATLRISILSVRRGRTGGTGF